MNLNGANTYQQRKEIINMALKAKIDLIFNISVAYLWLRHAKETNELIF